MNTKDLAKLQECAKRLGIVDFYGYHPKIHTIRRDEKNRWSVGKKIHFCIGVRTKNRYNFAPAIPLVSTQKIEIIQCTRYDCCTVFIDGECFYNPFKGINKGMLDFAKNDGFDSIDDFFAWIRSE